MQRVTPADICDYCICSCAQNSDIKWNSLALLDLKSIVLLWTEMQENIFDLHINFWLANVYEWQINSWKFNLFFFVEVCCGNSKHIFSLIYELCLIGFFLCICQIVNSFSDKALFTTSSVFVFHVQIILWGAYRRNFYSWQNELLTIIHIYVARLDKGMLLLRAKQWLSKTLLGNTTMITWWRHLEIHKKQANRSLARLLTKRKERITEWDKKQRAEVSFFQSRRAYRKDKGSLVILRETQGNLKTTGEKLSQGIDFGFKHLFSFCVLCQLERVVIWKPLNIILYCFQVSKQTNKQNNKQNPKKPKQQKKTQTNLNQKNSLLPLGEGCEASSLFLEAEIVYFCEMTTRETLWSACKSMRPRKKGIGCDLCWLEWERSKFWDPVTTGVLVFGL